MPTSTTTPRSRQRQSDALADNSQFDPEAVLPRIQHLLDADDPDINDPAFPLFEQYERWQTEEWRKRSNYRSSLGADTSVQMQEAQRMWDIGRLESESTDFMSIHTREALRLFIGRGADPDGKVARIPGAKSVASGLRALWIASGSDNPYADWSLLMAEEGLRARMESLDAARSRVLAQLEALEQKGLHLSLLRSKNPVKLELGFQSPYGFLVAQLVVTFDHYVRAIKTLQNRDLLSSDDARIELRSQQRPLRGLFDQILRQQSLLMRPVFSGITRAAFSSKSVETQTRVAELAQLWPGLPEPILTGELLPRHSRRQQKRGKQTEDSGVSDDGLL